MSNPIEWRNLVLRPTDWVASGEAIAAFVFAFVPSQEDVPAYSCHRIVVTETKTVREVIDDHRPIIETHGRQLRERFEYVEVYTFRSVLEDEELFENMRRIVASCGPDQEIVLEAHNPFLNEHQI